MRKHSILLLIAVLCIGILSGCGSALYDEHKNGYTQATSVRGVSFDMPSNFLEQATAITDISDEVDYSRDTYLYKNGKNMYLLFNMNGVVVAVEQGTNYNLRDAEDVRERITQTDVCEVWITDDQKISYDKEEKKGVYKLIAEAYADVSITSTLYTTCYGQFATIQYEEYECSLFVGVPCQNKDELTGNQKDTIGHIAKSFALDMEYVKYILEAEKTESEKESTSDKNTENQTEVDTEPDTNKAETETESTEVETTQPESTENKEETPNEEPKEDNNASSLGSNQSEAVNGYSDIYHMLSIGQMGVLDAGANDGKTLERTSITIHSLYIGDDAINIIKNHCATEQALYPYEKAPAGYAWHVIEYSLEKHPDDLYVDIKILGLDGEKLKFRGVPASSRTYDIFTFMEETENGYTKLYCYYAVPNGCKEYMLECGTRVEGTSVTACYKVSDWR